MRDGTAQADRAEPSDGRSRGRGGLGRVATALGVLLPLTLAVIAHVDGQLPLGEEISHDVETAASSSRLYASAATIDEVIGVGYQETSPNRPAAWATSGVGRLEPRGREVARLDHVQLWGVATDEDRTIAVGRRWLGPREREPLAIIGFGSGPARTVPLDAPEGNAIARAIAPLDDGGFVAAGTTWATEFGSGAADCRGERSSMILWTTAGADWVVRHQSDQAPNQCAQAVVSDGDSVVVVGYRDDVDGRPQGVILRFEVERGPLGVELDELVELTVDDAILRSVAVHDGDVHVGGSRVDDEQRRTAAVWRIEGDQLLTVPLDRSQANRINALASDGHRLWAAGGGAGQGAARIWATEPDGTTLERLRVGLGEVESLQSLTFHDGQLFAFGSAEVVGGEIRGAVAVFSGLRGVSAGDLFIAFWPVPPYLLVLGGVAYGLVHRRSRSTAERRR